MLSYKETLKLWLQYWSGITKSVQCLFNRRFVSMPLASRTSSSAVYWRQIRVTGLRVTFIKILIGWHEVNLIIWCHKLFVSHRIQVKYCAIWKKKKNSTILRILNVYELHCNASELNSVPCATVWKYRQHYAKKSEINDNFHQIVIVSTTTLIKVPVRGFMRKPHIINWRWNQMIRPSAVSLT